MKKGTSEFGKRMQRRYGALGMLIVAPFVLLGVGVKVFELHDYPAGDMRNEPWFWAAFGVAALSFVGIAMIGYFREVMRRDLEEPPRT